MRSGVASNRRLGKGSFTFTVQDGAMRWVLVPLLAGLAGCGVSDNLAAFIGSAADIGSVATFQRSPPDLVWSLISGRDCSVVRLDRGQSYCKPKEPPPEPQPFCTRSLDRSIAGRIQR